MWGRYVVMDLAGRGLCGMVLFPLSCPFVLILFIFFPFRHTPSNDNFSGLVDPGFCNTNLRMIHCTIDLSHPSNKAPQPHLEENEFIENFTVPLKDLYKKCKELEAEGYAIDARVSTLAEGIEVARRWKIT